MQCTRPQAYAAVAERHCRNSFVKLTIKSNISKYATVFMQWPRRKIRLCIILKAAIVRYKW